ncbi:pimeloyl-ACP methyl ester esterase BioH [Neiella marina]|uniref:Pimeloyl-[acyl-carrier protein] methyl ester esterase n=1 Tax=Neiella holothuriorum TaxID=2870530 RepID=A0ABS7EHI9_9GAMM|nr:pimeloyl-ACP methyl ester esterase BioH [Neiella holothuriorum]MBW8191246.1 pimeloyl-ACP methyl ester esterase BioH [Neiella holothuriorum]
MTVMRIGNGDDLVLLHGWGMNGAIFESWAERLKQHFCCHLVHLPGFGGSAACDNADLDEWLDALLPKLPEQAYWLGWSLGGLLVQRLAQRHPERVSAQLLVATTPHFPAVEPWRGIKPQVLAQFVEQLSQNPGKTIERFLAIQAMGSESAKQDIRQIKAQLSAHPAPNDIALQQGLALLQQVDFRDVATQPPQHWLLGKLDSLVPVALAESIQGVATVLPKASHAPFISHPEESTEWLLRATGKLD